MMRLSLCPRALGGDVVFGQQAEITPLWRLGITTQHINRLPKFPGSHFDLSLCGAPAANVESEGSDPGARVLEDRRREKGELISSVLQLQPKKQQKLLCRSVSLAIKTRHSIGPRMGAWRGASLTAANNSAFTCVGFNDIVSPT